MKTDWLMCDANKKQNKFVEIECLFMFCRAAFMGVLMVFIGVDLHHLLHRVIRLTDTVLL